MLAARSGTINEPLLWSAFESVVRRIKRKKPPEDRRKMDEGSSMEEIKPNCGQG